MTPSDRETAGQRIARARRRRGLSQAVLAGLVGRSESWLSQVERGKRGVDSHGVLVRLSEVLRAGIEELTGSADRDETGRSTHPAVPMIERAMMGYGHSRGGGITHVMVRLKAPELEIVDTLITAGIADSRAEAIRWALARISERPAYAQLREHTRDIQRLTTEF